jgi:hypothetical protein
MKIESHKQLESLIKMCMKNGVKSIQVDGISIELGDQPIKPKKYKQVAEPQDLLQSPTLEEEIQIPQMQYIQDDIKTPDELTEEQAMFWSSEGQQQ